MNFRLSYFAFTLLLLLFAACSKTDTRYQNVSGSVWHTTFNITYRSSADLRPQIINAMNEVEQSLSPFLTDSRISLINRNETDSIDQRIETVFNKSLEINRISRGAFDPTVAPLINLWGFGYENFRDEPTKIQIDSCLQYVGIADCSIVEGKIIKKTPETQFNFSAITKGFGVDQVAATLSEAGCSDYIVEIGGEIAVAGRNPSGLLWRIQIDRPDDSRPDEHSRLAVIEVTDCGIAGSGNYRNFRDTSEGRIGHTISPLTGLPVATSTVGVTVIAPTCMEADALATACMVMPADDAIAMIESLPTVSALFVTADGDKLISIPTSRFPKLISID